MLETRYMAFQPNFIPDMTAQTADRDVPFEGSTAGMMNAPDRGGLEDRDQPIRGDLERGGGARKSGVEGKRVSVRVDLGGRRIIQKKTDARRSRRQHQHIQ